jgi:hypothetical protein
MDCINSDFDLEREALRQSTALEFDTAEAIVQEFGGVKALVVRRFDRALDGMNRAVNPLALNRNRTPGSPWTKSRFKSGMGRTKMKVDTPRCQAAVIKGDLANSDKSSDELCGRPYR